MKKLRYFLSNLGVALSRERARCPSCGGRPGQVVDRKALIFRLMRCADCSLLYRVPTTAPARSQHYYDAVYQQGSTTEMPKPALLSHLLATGFRGTALDFTEKLELLQRLGVQPGAKLLDFGCSWGYGAWQFGQAGYRVFGYEVSRARAAYARDQLGVAALPDHEAIRAEAPFDVFFSSHVLEHVPSVEAAIRLACAVLRPGGVFVALTPNGSAEWRRTHPAAFHRLWGEAHPNMLDDVFYRQRFAGYRFEMSDAGAEELMIAVWKPDPRPEEAVPPG